MNWIKCDEKMPMNGQIVKCVGNQTLCCEEDMEEQGEHIATFIRKASSYRKDVQGNKYDITYSEIFKLGPEFVDGFVIKVEKWMPFYMSWIKTSEEEPPESLNRILVFTLGKNINVLHRHFNQWCLTECDYEDGNEFPGEPTKFTHWMPLPLLPETS